MATFLDNAGYSFNLVSKSDGVYLTSLYPSISELLDFETLAYYLKTYTLQKGHFINGFRKIQMDDGSVKYFGKEHPAYKSALKEETISMRDVSEGDTFSFDSYGEPTVVFIGSFYVKPYAGSNFRKRKHLFMNLETKNILLLNNAKKMISILGNLPEYSNKVDNYNELLNVNGFRNKYYFTNADN